MNRRLGALGTGLFACGLLTFGQGAWMVAKAQLAQVLLRQAWGETRAGGERIRPWPWADTWPVARLLVPELGVDQIVLAGAGGRVLAFAPGHVTGSASPGTAGNTVLAGHRDTHFRFLRDLAPGDRIVLVTARGERRRYRVTGARVAHRRETELLAPTDEPTLTLVTCFPFDGVAPGGPLRWVVTARADRGYHTRSTP